MLEICNNLLQYLKMIKLVKSSSILDHYLDVLKDIFLFNLQVCFECFLRFLLSTFRSDRSSCRTRLIPISFKIVFARGVRPIKNKKILKRYIYNNII